MLNLLNQTAVTENISFWNPVVNRLLIRYAHLVSNVPFIEPFKS